MTDENGVAVASARVQLQAPPPACRCAAQRISPGIVISQICLAGTYELRVEKTGFYVLVQSDVQVGVTANVDVTLHHQQEAREVVNVVESAPAIDPAQISTKEELTGAEIVDIPYPGSHDYRNALTFIPGVTPDAFGQAHVAGAETYQTLLVLDGFNVTQPTNGQLVVRTSVDSFRSIEVTPSREPAEFGKGSGGVLALNTQMGDDHFRVTSTDFIPGLQTIKGISIGQWTPIVTMSGPIRKGKTWFIDALDGEYDNNIIKQLPSGSDTDHVWRVDNLAKLQSNLTTRNIVTVSFLSNYYHDPIRRTLGSSASADYSHGRRNRLHRLAQRPILFSRRRAARNRIRGGPVQRGAHSSGKWSVHRDDPGSRGQLLPEREHAGPPSAGPGESLPSAASVARTP